MELGGLVQIHMIYMCTLHVVDICIKVVYVCVCVVLVGMCVCVCVCVCMMYFDVVAQECINLELSEHIGL